MSASVLTPETPSLLQSHFVLVTFALSAAPRVGSRAASCLLSGSAEVVWRALPVIKLSGNSCQLCPSAHNAVCFCRLLLYQAPVDLQLVPTCVTNESPTEWVPNDSVAVGVGQAVYFLRGTDSNEWVSVRLASDSVAKDPICVSRQRHK